MENKDIGGLYTLKIIAPGGSKSFSDLSQKIDYKIIELKNNK